MASCRRPLGFASSPASEVYNPPSDIDLDVNREEVLEALRKSFEAGLFLNHRRLVCLALNEPYEYLADILRCYDELNPEDKTLLLVSESRREGFLSSIERSGRYMVSPLEFRDIDEALGGTYDVLLLDLAERFSANDLGKLVEVVRGGGLVLLTTPPLKEFYSFITGFHERLVRTPYTIKDLRRNFEKRFLRKLTSHKAIWVLDEDKGLMGSEYIPARVDRSAVRYVRCDIPDAIVGMAATQDQVDVLVSFSNLLKDSWSRRRVFLVMANRGRGKSAVLGLMLASLTVRREFRRFDRIYVTAPTINNVLTLFEFLRKGLEALGQRFREVEDDSLSLTVRGLTIQYIKPFELMTKSVDVVFVDEAAGIPLEVLYAIVDKAKFSVFASTIHGYEGAGRGFYLRFRSRLRGDPSIRLVEMNMKKPIRYSDGDPVESWLYDVLMLNAEPAPLSFKPEELPGISLEYKKLDIERLFQDDKLLSDFVGIYVTAHYRNEPDDLIILGDSPGHYARALTTEDGVILVALHVAEEGSLPDEEIKLIAEGYAPPGNLIPSVAVKYYTPFSEFAKLRGFRIVRIATHPSLFRRGLGSKALKMLEEEASELGLDWVGAGFGASYEVLSFWVKNGYIPVHLSPVRNPSSGEYSTVVLKPLTEKASKLIKEMNWEFRLRLVNSLQDPYYHMPARVCRLLLTPYPSDYKLKPRLTESQLVRLKGYAERGLLYESCRDAFSELVKAHFLSSGQGRLGLDKASEELLAAKCLQGKPWMTVGNELGMTSMEVKQACRGLAYKLLKYYVNIEQ